MHANFFGGTRNIAARFNQAAFDISTLKRFARFPVIIQEGNG